MHVNVAQINLAGNNLCGIHTDPYGHAHGTYTAEGIKAIADSIAVTASLTSIDLQRNHLAEQCTALLRKAADGRMGVELWI